MKVSVLYVYLRKNTPVNNIIVPVVVFDITFLLLFIYKKLINNQHYERKNEIYG